MIGRGELLTEVTQEVKRINERFNGNFVELVPEYELVETLSTSKIFLSLQDYDNYPSQSLMEAMLFCNSVIATDYGDTSRLVHTANNNALISEKDPALLGKAIEMLLNDWKLNIANKKLIDEQFSAGVFTEYFFQMHRRIVLKN
jgi:glycosyltransferase involved in cell wall biosynthesis